MVNLIACSTARAEEFTKAGAAETRGKFMAKTTGASTDRGFFGHPRGLAVLFLTEMWERFSYYGMRGLLIIYLTQHFLFSDERSAVMYGAYTALVYIMTIIGGSLADRYLGQRKAVTFGAILLVLGHFGMAFEGQGSTEYLKAPSGEYQIEDEGRGDRRQLFIEYQGQERRLAFESATSATLEGSGLGTLTPRGDDGSGDYTLIRRARSLPQQVCLSLGLGCAGEDPVSTLELANGRSFPLTTTEAGGNAVLIDGQSFAFVEETRNFLLILDAASRAKDPMGEGAAILQRYESGQYTTRVEKQEIFVWILYFSLALIIAGVGYLKANISTIVGALYDEKDYRRDAGFTIFYMGINLGSFLSSVTCGILGIVYGWAWGFGLAGVGMALGLVVFLTGQKYLEGRAEPPNREKLKEKVFGPITVEAACYLTGIGIVAFSMATVKYAELIPDWFVGALGVSIFFGLVFYALLKLAGVERRRMLAAIYFVIAQIPFWALFEQAGSSLNLFTDRLVDKNLFGWNVPAPVFQALNAGYIVLFAPILAWLWTSLGKSNREPSTPVKFAIGVFGVGLGFLVLVAGMGTSGNAGMTAVTFIFLIYLIHTLAELMLSPVGLSAVTKLAPARVVGMTMGAGRGSCSRDCRTIWRVSSRATPAPRRLAASSPMWQPPRPIMSTSIPMWPMSRWRWASSCC
jgi:proton-dependent oligopeptide transporter, POT family